MTHNPDTCPLEPVHRRLEDLHRIWHDANDSYFDPEKFRVAIQSAIQTARTVSFILQSNKEAIPNFDAWYAPWQEKLRADALMRWMVEARNKIEKQGDLETYSVVRAELVGSYLSEEVPTIEVPAKLSDAPIALVRGIPQNALGEHLRRQGIVRIQRRWVENTLPDYELLDAVAIAYGRLSQILSDAHLALGMIPQATVDIETEQTYHDELREGRLPCMIGHGELRSLDVWLADGRPVELKKVERKIDRASAEKAAERYDIDPAKMFGSGGGPEGVLRGLYATAKHIFLKDGYHLTLVWLLKDDKPVHFEQMVFEEHGHKYLMMRELANEVVRRGADALIMIGESWSAVFDPSAPYRRAQDAPDRVEQLVATLVRKEGEPIQLSATIERTGTALSLAEEREVLGGAQFMYAPIYEAWGREVPKQWAKGMGDAKSPREEP